MAAPGIAECDRNAWPCYLTSTNSRNHPFYNRLGYELIAEFQPPAGAPMVYPMWREPR